MCVGFTNNYRDFKPERVEEAIEAAVPGSAVSFDRIGFFHFAIFLGWAWPRGGDSEAIPLLCHLSGDVNTVPAASVRLDDFKDTVQDSIIRVYNCICNTNKRSQVILECLYRVGKIGYNPLTNNCEHFVREVICGESVSYQALWTVLAPVVQLPRLIIGSALGGAATSSASMSCISRLDGNRSLGLLNPDMDLIEILVSGRGLRLKGIKLNSVCTREFESSSAFPMQTLYTCRSCSSFIKSVSVCKPCRRLCHKDCALRDGRFSEDSCQCSHAKRSEPSQLAPQEENHCAE